MKILLTILALGLISTPSYAQMEHGEHSGHDMSASEHMMMDGDAMSDSTSPEDMTSEDQGEHKMSFKQIEASHVCMVNDTAFDKAQIPVEVDGKTYYGCCSMCEARLKKDAAIRSAVDPISGNTVDKTEAVIGAGADGKVQYFENIENLNQYAMDNM